MTAEMKGVAQQLRDGSANLDKMQNEILQTARILKDRLEVSRKRKLKIDFLLDCKTWERGGAVLVNYRWKIFVGSHRVVIKCLRVTDVFLMDFREEDAFISFDGQPTKTCLMEDTQGVHASLDEFVTALLAQFPNMEYELKPLLDAGQ